MKPDRIRQTLRPTTTSQQELLKHTEVGIHKEPLRSPRRTTPNKLILRLIQEGSKDITSTALLIDGTFKNKLEF